MAFVKANSFRPANRGPAAIERVVIHTAEIGETRSSAEQVAAFFAKPTTPVSAHLVIDNNSVVRCVRDEDIAFHALGDNDGSLGYELSGFAGQSFKQWRDDYSRAVVELAAQEAAKACHAYGIPVRWLSDDQLEARQRGLVTHDAVSRVFGDDIRDDPGRNFPFELMERRTEFHLAKLRKVVSWEVSFVNANDERTEQTVDDWQEWALSHGPAGQRGRIVISPKERA